MIGSLRGFAEPYLPEGCPFVIGGGLIRDAILGGRPSDIDCWLPTNITNPDVMEFCEVLADSFPDWNITILFQGPGSRGEPLTNPAPIAGTPEGIAMYGDVNNNWVVEMTHVSLPNVNFMRSMTPWRNDAQAYFNSIMRAFDFDQCMYFIGYMPGQVDVNTVIIPAHMAAVANGAAGQFAHGSHIRLNEVYWNQWRLNNTSRDRILARIRKMNTKYEWFIPEDVNRIQMMPTESIIATPIPLATVMRLPNLNGGWGHVALPRPENRRDPRPPQQDTNTIRVTVNPRLQGQVMDMLWIDEETTVAARTFEEARERAREHVRQWLATTEAERQALLGTQQDALVARWTEQAQAARHQQVDHNAFLRRGLNQ